MCVALRQLLATDSVTTEKREFRNIESSLHYVLYRCTSQPNPLNFNVWFNTHTHLSNERQKVDIFSHWKSLTLVLLKVSTCPMCENMLFCTPLVSLLVLCCRCQTGWWWKTSFHKLSLTVSLSPHPHLTVQC